MDNSLRALCDAIKKILAQLKPQVNQLSFIVVTGKNEQGKSSLLKQSNMEEMSVFSEQQVKIYYNQQGIMVELGANWLSTNKSQLQSTLKQLNKCNRFLKVTGLILCVDVNELQIGEPAQFAEQKKAHLHLLERLGTGLGYQLDLGLIFTKMDTLAGFSEFYQMDHASDLAKPLGFSLDCINQMSKKVETYTSQFNWLIELLGQQVIHKMHPARSTIKRSLIREFPLQFAGLRGPIQALVQGISPKLFNLNSIFFTSAEQGGVSIDRLNKKIQHEYALIVQDTFPQATNYRAYFIEGALKTIQSQCTQGTPSKALPQKKFIAIAAGLAGVSLLVLAHSYYKASHLLDEASKELLAYDTLNNQGNNGAQAIYHLSNAAKEIESISSNSISLPFLQQLKAKINNNANHRIQGEFLPSLTNELEAVMVNSKYSPLSRYQALKIYLMLGQPEHFSAVEIQSWFNQLWHEPTEANTKKLALLKQTLNKSFQALPIKAQIVSDARNYLNALPTSYLYYSLAKQYFPSTVEKISIEGFNLATNELPKYFTRAGFDEAINKIPNIAASLQTENWVLAHQDLAQLQNMIVQAYCYDYVNWWQTFMKKSQPKSYQDYQQGHQIAKTLQQSNAFTALLNLVQQQTMPSLNAKNSLFNQSIANQFTELNLVSLSSTKELTIKIAELEQFTSTLSIVNDGGKTAYIITKTRFTNDFASDPVSSLFNQARQLPEPLKTWTRQLAGDAWVILIKDSRAYINQQWQQTVYKEFQNTISSRYPFDSTQTKEIAIPDFNRFFATHGLLNNFTEEYIKPFLDTSKAAWTPKTINDTVLPIASETIDAIIRANIITNMFFPDRGSESKIDFSLQKISLDPVVSSLNLEIGKTKLSDTQGSDTLIRFTWPQSNATLALDSIEGNHYELSEKGTWAIFKLLEKVNVLVDEQDSSSLQILFEVNSNSGRYLLKTNNQINPFTPGILNGFSLKEAIV